jgi:oligosaccharide repeat unit polymerase
MDNGSSILSSIRESFFYVVSGISFIYADRRKLKLLKILSLVLIFIYIIFILLRGSRNAALMMALPIIFYSLLNSKFSLFRVIIVSSFIFFVGYFIGIVRNIGFDSITGIDIGLASFDPLGQEFGTSYSVLTKSWDMRNAIDLQFGKTYFIDPIMNFIPRSIWPSRPPSIAMKFSMSYFGVNNANELNEGLGYSSILEAINNFGIIGVGPVFFFFYLFYQKFVSFISRGGGILNILLNGYLCVFALNFMRIDFAIDFKIYFVYALILFFTDRLLTRNK